MRTILLILLIGTCSLFAQSNQLMISDPIDQAYLEHLIKEGIDSVRQRYRLSPLANDSILYVAAKHHANYLKKKGKISHYEKGKRGYVTPQDRANSYGIAENCSVGENVALNYYLTRVTAKRKRTTIHKSYQQLAKAIVTQWVKSPPHFKNMRIPTYSTTGLAVAINEADRSVFIVQKFGDYQYSYEFEENKTFFKYSNYEAPEVVKDFDVTQMEMHDGDHAWKTKSPSDEASYLAANEIIQADPRILKIDPRGRSIKVSTTGVEHLYQFIKKRRDGLAIEVMSYDEYHCGNPQYYEAQSRRNHQCEYSGRLLKPVYKRKLKPRIEANYGEKFAAFDEKYPFYKAFFMSFQPILRKEFRYRFRLPKDVGGYLEFNLVYLKDNEVMRVRHLSGICGEEKENHPIPSIRHILTDDSLFFELPTIDSTYYFYFPRGSSSYALEDITPFMYQGFERYIIDSAKVEAYSSIEGMDSINDRLQRERANSIMRALENRQDEAIAKSIHTESNWDLFYEQLEESTDYQHLRSMLREEAKICIDSLLQLDTTLSELELMLDSQRFASIRLKTHYNYKDFALELYQDYYRYFMRDFDQKSKVPKGALGLDVKFHQLLNSVALAIEKGYIDQSQLSFFKPPWHQDMRDCWYTYYAINYHYGSLEEDSLRWTNLHKKIDVGQPLPPVLILHNAISERFQNARKDPKGIAPLIDKLEADINLLGDWYNKVADADSFRLALYIEVLNNRKKFGRKPIFKNAGDFVFAHYSRNKVPNEELLDIAELFVHIEDHNRAYLLLHPYVDLDNPDLPIISLYTKLIYQNSQEYPYAGYSEWLKKIYPLYTPEEWCGLFVGPCNISFQAFDDKSVRDLYCKACADFGNYATNRDKFSFLNQEP